MALLRIIYDVEGWAYHGRALALRKHAPGDFVVEIAPYPRRADVESAIGSRPADVVLLLPAPRAETVRAALRDRGWSTKLVTSWSYPWPHDLAALDRAYEHSAWVVFTSRSSWESAGRPPRSSAIANGVDRDVFHVVIPPERRRTNVLWVGSQVYRQLKGYDDFIVPLFSELRGRGVDCEALLVDSRGPERRSAAAMCEWYNRGTVLVCASREEGTPNPALEAAACGCTIVSTRVGNMPELIRDGENGYIVERDLAALAGAVDRAGRDYPRLAGAMAHDIAAWDWKLRGVDYFELFRRVLGGADR